MAASGKSTPRRWRRRLAYLAAALLLFVVAHPIWLPWLAASWLAPQGVHWQEVERGGWTRLRLRGVEATIGSVHATVRELEVPAPLPVLFRRFVSAGAAAPRIVATGWRVDYRADGTVTNTAAAGPQSLPEMLDLAESVVHESRRWLAALELRDGEARFGAFTAKVPAATWTNDTLRLTGGLATQARQIAAELHLPPSAPARLRLSSPSDDLDLDLRLRLAGQALAATGELRWLSNRVALDAGWEGAGFWPRRARVVGHGLRLPAQALGTDAITNSVANLEFNWADGAGDLRASATAQPILASLRELGPFAADIEAHTDGTSATLQRLQVRARGQQATLGAPVRIAFDGQWLTPDTRLDLKLDLASLSIAELAGELVGQVDIHADTDRKLALAFKLSGQALGWQDFGAPTAALTGSLVWPELRIGQLDLALKGGGQFHAAGSVDLARRFVAGAKWEFAGVLPAALQPAGLDFGKVQSQGEVTGPFAALRHQGRLGLDALRLPGCPPLAANLDWRGEATHFEAITARLRAGRSALRLAGAAAISQSPNLAVDARIEQFDAACAQTNLVQLTQPVSVRWAKPNTGDTNAFALELGAVQLSGAAGELALSGALRWPGTGAVQVTATRLDPTRFQDFVATPIPPGTVPRFQAQASWANGPAEFALDTAVAVQLPDQPPWELTLAAQSDASGVQVSRVRWTEAGATLIDTRTHLPVRLWPGHAHWLAFDRDAPLNLAVQLEPGNAVWRHLPARLGLTLEGGQVELRFAGTYHRPEATLNFRAARLRVPAALVGTNLPPIENVELTADLKPDELVLSHFAAAMLGQRVEAQARLPLDLSASTDWTNPAAVLDWPRASGEVRVQQLQLATLARLAPQPLLTTGEVSAVVRLQPGRQLRGRVAITNATTVPLPELGALRELQATIAISNRTAIVEGGQVRYAGQPLFLRGQVEWSTHALPVGEVTITGTNLSLWRAPNLFLRGGLDLTLTRTNGAPPLLAGTLQLTNSLYLPELSGLILDVTRPEQRPPFFSVREPGLAVWRLDVSVQGDRFLRVVSPFFKGELSTALRLQGSLHDPVAVGDVSVAAGRLLFPFGALNVDNGRVSLTREDPYRPRLALSASGENFGYTVRAEVSGPADAPTMTFDSIPALSSKEILLMLAAGEMPRQEVRFGATSKVSRIGTYFGSQLVSDLLGQESSADRLQVRSGEEVTDTGGLSYSVEYKLTDRLSAIGFYDRFRTLNMGLKVLIYSR